MNDFIINNICNNLNIDRKSVINTLNLLKDGNTIPFIARYRKEATGGLNEVIIKDINDVYLYQVNLEKRKDDVIRLIKEKDLLTDSLEKQIRSCDKLVDVEDLYRPFKEKKKTKASIAIKNGLEGLAKIIMSFPKGDIDVIVDNYKECVPMDNSLKLEGAKYIIAEWISDNAVYRKWIRNYIYNNGIISTSKKKNDKDSDKTYEMYYSYSERIKFIKPHRVLAINRGENVDVLSVSIDNCQDDVLNYLKKHLIKDESSSCSLVVIDAINDSLKRLIYPSVKREIRADLTDKASLVAIDNFSSNVENLLLTPPMKEVNVLGFDPAFRTGCKLAVLDKQGNVLKIDKIYPHEPVCDVINSKKKVIDLINQYDIDIIAIGNGTASRESEKFISDTLKEIDKDVKYAIVNEAGASIYSASDLAISEFPKLDVSERSAISIGRRLQDPLSELVKIDPKGIGVGLYQHDVKQKDLDSALNFAVSNVVNAVGVNINTASFSILSYISGLTKKSIEKIFSLRDSLGKFKSRNELKKALSSKTYEQAIGFIRINDGVNPLDKTRIHPESYDKTYKLLDKLNLSLSDIGSSKIKDVFVNSDLDAIREELDIDKYTFTEIISALKEPLNDPRDVYEQPILRSDILTIDDLTLGMKLQGVVRNVTPFGAFVDIGLHNDGLVHISEMSNSYVKDPNDIVEVGDIVSCYVKDIKIDKGQVALSFKG